MKSKIFKNFGLKVLALFFAFILWLVVMNVSDYAVTTKINDIPVTQLNGDALSELDQIYDVTKGNTVDIIIKGRRSLVDGLTANDFVATADLSTMSITNTVQIFVEPKSALLQDEITITCVDNTMTLSLEDRIETELPVSIKVLGTVEEGYSVAATTSTPNIITVSGPKTTVSKITRAEVEVNVDGKSDSFETNATLQLYDAYDEIIESDKLTISDESVVVKVDVFPIKTVPVTISTVGETTDGYLVSDILYQPKSIQVAGREEDLAALTKIVVDDISVEGLSRNYEATVDITDYLPDGITIAQANQEVVVTINVEKAVSKTIKPDADAFTLLNSIAGNAYGITLSDDFEIVVTGLEKDVKSIDAASLNLRLDCTNLYYGLYTNVDYEMQKDESLTYEITGTVDVNVSEMETENVLEDND